MRHLRFFLLALMASTIMSAFAQNEDITVSGTVVDNNGEPVIGASVIQKGTSNGAVTDLDGHFSVKVPQGTTLTISYIGFSTQDVKAAPNLQIKLVENSKELSEVVVTGYQIQRKADLTGAVSVVKTEGLTTSPDADPMKSLQGKIAGMTITDTGSPSGTATVRIRGIGSFNSSQDPLYIIDGVPMTAGSLNTLNSNDIESMQVLKDAASASIYGSRAANGVIIITTKHGKKNDRINVDFTSNLTAQFYTSQSKMKLLDTKGYATAMAQAALNDGLDPEAYANNYGLTLNAPQGVGITVWNPATSQYVNYTVNGRYDGYINSKQTMGFSDTDWIDAISRTGFSQNYNVAISKATDKASELFSLGYKNNSGILKYTNFESLSARMNTSFKW